MNELIEFLTSQEIMIIYCISGLACLLCVIIYFVEKNNDNFRKKHNTRELNKLVEEVKEEAHLDDELVDYGDEPVLQVIEEDNVGSVDELIDSTMEIENLGKEIEAISYDDVETKEEPEPIIIEPMDIVTEVYEEPVQEELEYTSIEPDEETAQMELQKLTEELKKQEELEVTQNITLTNYEEQQEENAIISLEELIRKGKDVYQANELSQYVDEGNEPISIQELEEKAGNNVKEYVEPFIIENVVSEEDLQEVEEQVEVVRPKVHLDDFNTITEERVEEIKKFKNSPIISPIFGIEKNDSNELELENTANYEKLDEEIKRTNEFLMTMKELQNKLD